MASDKKVNFIIVDDNELDCFVADRILRHTKIANGIQAFLHASNALEYIKSVVKPAETTVILLDIVMPVMNAVDFLEEFEKLSDEKRSDYRVVAFTSSMNKRDINKVKGFKSVIELLDKPITPEAMVKLVSEIN